MPATILQGRQKENVNHLLGLSFPMKEQGMESSNVCSLLRFSPPGGWMSESSVEEKAY
jgi:hypothetical protein